MVEFFGLVAWYLVGLSAQQQFQRMFQNETALVNGAADIERCYEVNWYPVIVTAYAATRAISSDPRLMNYRGHIGIVRHLIPIGLGML